MTLSEQEIAANPIGTEVIFEDDQVRVWRIMLQPGEEAPFHTHELDYTTVVIEGDEIERYNGDGSADKLILQPGAIMRWHQGPQQHSLRNTGAQRFHNVVVEVKAINADFTRSDNSGLVSVNSGLVQRVPLPRRDA
jgi:predicted metal-dependent enzyme (double-stranded beta helix superfamily)